MMIKKIMTTLNYRNEAFKIIQFEDGWYGAINTKNIDKNGKLTKALNGFQLHASKQMGEVIKGVMDELDLKSLGINKDNIDDNLQLVMDVTLGKYRA